MPRDEGRWDAATQVGQGIVTFPNAEGRRLKRIFLRTIAPAANQNIVVTYTRVGGEVTIWTIPVLASPAPDFQLDLVIPKGNGAVRSVQFAGTLSFAVVETVQ